MRFWGMWQPADYRRQAAKYLAKARSASSYERRVRYSELASLHLAYAEMRERKIAAESIREKKIENELIAKTAKIDARDPGASSGPLQPIGPIVLLIPEPN